MKMQQSDIGLVGLGVMGRNLAFNMADHGFSVVGYDRDQDKLDIFEKEGQELAVQTVQKADKLDELLRRPRVVMMLVPAGAAVDDVINDILPALSSGDIVIDGGNSHFNDTNIRGDKLSKRDIHFFGIGISGGERGARYGPSIMPGGPQEAYERIRPLLESIAAHVEGEPCTAYLGPGSAGHYVKMVHNGIEYGLMQLIAETYHLLSKGLGCSDDELSEIYANWNEGDLSSFLLEITVNIFRRLDERTEDRLIDVILDEAHQKGTGLWTSESALELHVPTPNINAGVEARDMSVYKMLRCRESEILSSPSTKVRGEKKEIVENIRQALYTATVLTYTQGFALLAHASTEYHYDLNLAQVAGVWRGGCIIRSLLLQDIVAAYKRNSKLQHLLIDKKLSDLVVSHQDALRYIVTVATKCGIPMPGMMAALAYYDSLRSAWLPANLIQAQRDYFGSHTYERVDRKGTFHTAWLKKGAKDESIQTT